MRDALQHQSRIVCKPKMDVKRGLADEHTPLCSDRAEFGKTAFHKRLADATALHIGFDRNRAKSIPASSAITDGYRRERNMSYDAAGIFGNQRN